MESDRLLIDNSRTVYHRVRLRCGVQVQCQPTVLGTCPVILDVLNTDLDHCLRILPSSVHALVRRTRIWINLTYAYGNRNQPNIVNHTTTHHHEAWLLWARDRPDKAHGIEIYNATDYIRMRQHWNGCGLILHELCHLIHQHVLGLDYAPIACWYHRAAASGRYDRVVRRDWIARDTPTDLAYAMLNAKEFFAELSVTYWATGYTDLDGTVSSPPVLEMTISSNRDECLCVPWIHTLTKSAVVTTTLHCNKFYPFTRGQLKCHDATLENDMHCLWLQIAEWDDPQQCNARSCCWVCPPWKRRQAPEQSDPPSTPLLNNVNDTMDL